MNNRECLFSGEHQMELNVRTYNRIISDYENGKTPSDEELDLLEQAVLSGAVRGLVRQGIPLLGMRAKTKLFEQNFYLLESVRVLALCGRYEQLKTEIERILLMLKSKCYGRFCPTGECYETSVCVLRFLRAVCPQESAWITQMENGIRVHAKDKIRTKAVLRYVEHALA